VVSRNSVHCCFRGASLLGLLVLAGLAAGCSAGQGTVSGKVLFNGKPLPGGWLTFRPTDPSRNNVTAQIDENGHYEAVLPAGDVKIAVDNREWEPVAARKTVLPPGVTLPPAPKATADAPAATSAPSRPPGSYVPIPAKFYDADSSGLKLTVASGKSQTHDIELK
jgi:hypothetical protein